MARPRKLRNDDDSNVAVGEPPISKIETETTVRTQSGRVEAVPKDGFSFDQLKTLKPYHMGDKLPPPELKRNRAGKVFVTKVGEPRFYLKGNKLMKTHMGMFGRKEEIFKLLKPEKFRLHKQIRTYLVKQGIPTY